MIRCAAALLLTVLSQSAEKQDAPFGWKAGKEHRFVWVQDGRKVGETTFQVEAAPPQSADKTPAVPEKAAPKKYRLEATRRYDGGRVTQRARETTSLLGDGTPLKFEETLDGTSVDNRPFHQETHLEFADGKARASYTQGTKPQKSAEVEIPKGTFLYANQAVEHWAIFLSKLSASVDKQIVKLYYPDFSKVMDVTFEKAGSEKIQVGQGLVETTRYRFSSVADHLAGSVWLDASRRLTQIEFPGTTKEQTLRVTLAE